MLYIIKIDLCKLNKKPKSNFCTPEQNQRRKKKFLFLIVPVGEARSDPSFRDAIAFSIFL